MFIYVINLIQFYSDNSCGSEREDGDTPDNGGGEIDGADGIFIWKFSIFLGSETGGEDG